jgi:Lrp/AsnC family transcriptional regulator, leucine-responsive regulatory protein
MSASLSVLPVTNRQAPALDAIDLTLMEELRRDGRLTHEELSRRVSLSRPAVVQRLKRLQDVGAIRGYTMIPDWEMLGLPILAFVRVRTIGHCRDTARHIMQMSDSSALIEECHRTTGEWCLLVKIRARSSGALEAFLDRMRDEENVQATMTTLALSTLRSA